MAVSFTVRFYAELNDLLPAASRQRDLARTLPRSASVKDVIESFGVPHTEVDVVLVGGRSVGFDHLVGDGERVAVYPVFEALDVQTLTRLRPAPLRVTRFVLDVHLGRLARFLRVLGFDCLYRNDLGDADLARLSRDDHRILLTCDRGLLKRSSVTHGYCLRSRQVGEQVVEVARRFDLAGSLRPFTRCSVCNGVLREATADEAATAPARVRQRPHVYRRCLDCGRLYWDGTHVDRLERLVAEVRAGVMPQCRK